MALRDRQIRGIPLTEGQSEIFSHLLTALVPVLGYMVWYPAFGIPEEIQMLLAVLGVLIHLAQSTEIVPNNVERNLLWMGSYTGVSFSNGIKFIPRLPFPFFLLLIRVVFGEEFYRKIFWSLQGDVPVRSIIANFQVEGLARGGRVRIDGTLQLEVEVAATYLSQTTAVGEEKVIAAAVAKYMDTVKATVLAQHTPAELMRGYHSGGSKVLSDWMTEAWNFVQEFGLRLVHAHIGNVKILSEQVERAFDRVESKEIFIAGAESLAETFAAFKASLPEGTSEEVALSLFNMDRIESGQSPVTLNVVKFK